LRILLRNSNTIQRRTQETKATCLAREERPLWTKPISKTVVKKVLGYIHCCIESSDHYY
jgi:hypothetical protein